MEQIGSFTNGLILQWGTGTNTTQLLNQQILPLAYTPIIVVGTTQDTENAYIETFAASHYAQGSFKYTIAWNGQIANGRQYCYIAICIA